MSGVGASEIRELIEAAAELDQPAVGAKAFEIYQWDAGCLEVAGTRDTPLLGQSEGAISERFYDFGHALLYIAVIYK
jgi:hypothetical protein